VHFEASRLQANRKLLSCIKRALQKNGCTKNVSRTTFSKSLISQDFLESTCPSVQDICSSHLLCNPAGSAGWSTSSSEGARSVTLAAVLKALAWLMRHAAHTVHFLGEIP
jgi:hypothetical protein